MAAMAAFRASGLRIPEDVSVVGYDDNPYAQYHVPPLTTVRQDTRLAGSLLVEKMIQLLDGARPESTLLPTELIVRAT
jgi:DNA-binding LacI/PurR family transcriptional regulator